MILILNLTVAEAIERIFPGLESSWRWRRRHGIGECRAETDVRCSLSGIMMRSPASSIDATLSNDHVGKVRY